MAKKPNTSINWIQKDDKLVVDGAEDLAVQLDGDVYNLWQGASECLGEFATEDEAKLAGEDALENRVNPKFVMPSEEMLRAGEAHVAASGKSKKDKDEDNGDNE